MMRAAFTAFASGLIFALGLGIAGMTRPSKVIGFLDVAGSWDPSLMFVMLGAIGVHFLFLRLVILKRGRPVFAERLHIPTRKDIDLRLVLGAVLFGIGWGLVGYCPGPALVSLSTLRAQALIFVAAMAVGMLSSRLVSGGRKGATADVPAHPTTHPTRGARASGR